MTTVNPSTGQPLPPDAIQRVLFIAPKVHVYQIPPLTSTKGYNAATWTSGDGNARQIFTARLRIMETALPAPDGSEVVTTDIVLEDPSNGQLFAGAPYTSPGVVEQVLDSSRFFAVRVQGEGGRKAVLGIGFEERSDAFDFGVTLQEVRRVNSLDNSQSGARKGGRAAPAGKSMGEKKDFSLKEGETITVSIGGKGRRSREESRQSSNSSSAPGSPFSLPPPPKTLKSNGGTLPFLPPPPSAQDVKAQRRLSRQNPPQLEETDGDDTTNLGFDDGEFGEFQ